jgi:K+-sensing histidine kinase KdpD
MSARPSWCLGASSSSSRRIEDARRIFDKFRRGVAGRGGRGNVGLGLYFAKVAMEAQGGSIELCPTAEWAVSFVLRFRG